MHKDDEPAKPGWRGWTTDNRAMFRLTGEHITWICGCGKPISSGTGYITTDDHIADRYAHESEEFWRRREQAESGNGIALTRASDIPFHAPVPWRAWHQKCDPNPEDDAYWFDVHRADTLRKLMHWAGHLMGKTWVTFTDLPDLLMRMGQDA